MRVPVQRGGPDKSVADPVIRHLEDIEAVACSCGRSTRLITADDDSPVSLHVTHIEDGREHFHELTDEVYYVIEGEGKIELDGRVREVSPGTAVYIPAGVAHRGCGGFTAVIASSPPFDPDDEIVTTQPASQ